MPRTIDYPITDHGRERMAQRGVSEDAIALAIRYGDRYPAGAGQEGRFISRRVVRRMPELAPHLGTVAVISADGAVVTAVHNPDFRPRKVWRRYQLKSGHLSASPALKHTCIEG